MNYLLLKELYRSKGIIAGLLILLTIGILSIHIGKIHIDRQANTIELTKEFQNEYIKRHIHYVDDHIGLLLYYIKFGFANDSSALAGLSLGQRDLRQAAQLITIRNLEEQKNTSELLNPFFQLLGNLDFSFVLIYLFPLIIIPLCFDLWSQEKESGRWALLSVQSERPKNILSSKLLLRLCFIVLLLIALLSIAILYINIPIDSSIFNFAILSLLYICFWFSISWWVTSLGKSSKQNAIILLSCWLLLTFVIPATTSSVITMLYPIPEAYDTTIDSRDGYHTKWDKSKEPTIEKFKEHYPQYKQYSHPKNSTFSWFWYYAMQQMGDDEALQARKSMRKKLDNRNKLAQSIGYLVPTIHTQLNMNALSNTDMTNYLNYMDALEIYHENLRLSFYPKIFENKPIKSENWNNYTINQFSPKRKFNLFMFVPLALANLFFLALAYFTFRKTTSI